MLVKSNSNSQNLPAIFFLQKSRRKKNLKSEKRSNSLLINKLKKNKKHQKSLLIEKKKYDKFFKF